MKKKEVIMLEKYINVAKMYRSFDQQQAAKTRMLNALGRAGWPLDAAGFIAKFEAEKGELTKIEGIGPVYEAILVDAANAIYKDLKKTKKTKAKDKQETKNKKK